jgi:SAM-dependent methyltransferase
MNVHQAIRPYTNGKGLEIGPGYESTKEYKANKIAGFPTISKDMMYYDIVPHPGLANCTTVFPSGDSFDFVVASHVLEHTSNPISELDKWLRVIKPNGFLCMIIPNQQATFDKCREITTLDHFLADFFNPRHAEITARQHAYKQIHVTKVTATFDLDKSIELGYPHMHTWTPETLTEFFVVIKPLLPAYAIEKEFRDDPHMVMVLKRLAP